jgi:hypothetical protein
MGPEKGDAIDQPLRTIAETLGIRLKTVRRAASNRRFPVELIGNMLFADPEAVRHHFATRKPGRPPKPKEAKLWVTGKSGKEYPTRPNLVLYSEGKLSDDDFDRLMKFCDREPDLADKIMEAIDDGKIWVPSPD